MYVVMGATGRTGHRIVHHLLQAGERVLALGRSESRLAPLAAAGAQVRAGEQTDPAFLAEAFRGATAAYTLLPYELSAPGYDAQQDRQGEAIVEALRRSGLREVVALSSLGADLAQGTGPIMSMRRQEQRLRAWADEDAGRNALALRAGAFMENFYGSLEVIKAFGFNGDAFDADYPLPMIAARDIADAAAGALLRRDWRGLSVRELLGERDLSYAQATRILGERIGLPELAYVRLEGGDALDALVQGGFAPDLAAQYVELAHTISAGRVRSLEGRNAGNTTATSFEAFAEELAQAYRAM
ncbi:NAD(P)H-binding protein [Lysobacter sp. K5869]|uniref:NmrA family NAD(P)-binding protein n=1 Tax=Lysobacter sp. K5869 TaxID=2820808 RepID=UPI001C0604A4|nr:NAD(P)H-binding protein [Lysobacter sp. K5869]QWP76109.1 NAD(P)H-binding protein [Lysobacter sp. K5869]